MYIHNVHTPDLFRAPGCGQMVQHGTSPSGTQHTTLLNQEEGPVRTVYTYDMAVAMDIFMIIIVKYFLLTFARYSLNQRCQSSVNNFAFIIIQSLCDL